MLSNDLSDYAQKDGGRHTVEQKWTHRERSNMRTREDAMIYKRLNAYDLDEGYGELLEEVDEELGFEEEEDNDFDGEE